MLLFSVLCLLKATVSQALQMEPVVVGKIYRTKPPCQIAAFADGEPNALLYAKRLQDKKRTSEIIEIKDIIGDYYIENVYQTDEGWIVRHRENNSQVGTMFDSYVFSKTIKTWKTLEVTISSTLANFMRDYKVAFSVPQAKTQSAIFMPDGKVAFPVLQAKTQSVISAADLVGRLKEISQKRTQEIPGLLAPLNQVPFDFSKDQKGMQEALSCVKSLLKIRETCEAAAVELFLTVTTKVDEIFKYIIQEKNKTEECFLADASIEKLQTLFKKFASDSDSENQVFSELFSAVMRFQYVFNGLWPSSDGVSTNNCLVLSIGQTPGALDKIVQFLFPVNEYPPTLPKPESMTWEVYWPCGGKILRRRIMELFEAEKDMSLVRDCISADDAFDKERAGFGKSSAQQLEDSQAQQIQAKMVQKYKLGREFLPYWIYYFLIRKIPQLSICALRKNGQFLTNYGYSDPYSLQSGHTTAFVENTSDVHFNALRFVGRGVKFS